jgi:hypothetical protein
MRVEGSGGVVEGLGVLRCAQDDSKDEHEGNSKGNSKDEDEGNSKGNSKDNSKDLAGGECRFPLIAKSAMNGAPG